ncbi:hypothetical protein [Roseovarius salinarum]|uniref:hypothetical protein n=1 Tax=Roseovarius salinarum TaxID=1981892 RepID=UPI000C3425E3|nr:hypothetical protein [Roseovarius salinarum]
MIRPASIVPTLAAAALAALTLGPAKAEGRLSYTADAGKMGQMKMTERWRGDALRTDIEGVDAYMLLRGDEVFSVTTAGGQPMVVSLSAMKDMAAGMGQGGADEKTGVVFPETIDDIRATGERREVAGIPGEVYEVDWIDNEGTAHTDTAVLTENAALRAHQEKKMAFIRAVSGDEPNPLMVTLTGRGLAPLTFGDRYRVTGFGDDAGPAGDFELPAEPMDLGNMTNMGME